jgi:hypothetical protein
MCTKFKSRRLQFKQKGREKVGALNPKDKRLKGELGVHPSSLGFDHGSFVLPDLVYMYLTKGFILDMVI